MVAKVLQDDIGQNTELACGARRDDCDSSAKVDGRFIIFFTEVPEVIWKRSSKTHAPSLPSAMQSCTANLGKSGLLFETGFCQLFCP